MRKLNIILILLLIIGTWPSGQSSAFLRAGWRAGPVSVTAQTCPHGGSGGPDGCGSALFAGLYYAPAVNLTTQPTAAQWGTYARQSGQSWVAGDHPQTWNLAGVDYPVGPDTLPASQPNISTWNNSGGAGWTNCGTTNKCGCTYYPADLGAFAVASQIPTVLATTYGWPHEDNAGLHYTLYNTLYCAGGGSETTFAIQNWNFKDTGNGGCAAVVVNDSSMPFGSTMKIYDNTFDASGTRAASCWGCLLSVTAGCQTTGNTYGLIQVLQTPFKGNLDVESNYFNGEWATVDVNTHAIAFNQLEGDLNVNFNILYEMNSNPITSASKNLTTQHACSNGQSITGLGASWPWQGVNYDLRWNYVEGIGNQVGYGHGEEMDGNMEPTVTTISSATEALSSTTLTSSATNIPLGAMIFNLGATASGGSLAGSTETLNTTETFATGQVIVVAGVVSTTGNWNGTFAVTAASAGTSVSFVNASATGSYTSGGTIAIGSPTILVTAQPTPGVGVYTVTNPSNFTITPGAATIRTMQGTICEFLFDYQTILAPSASAASTTSFFFYPNNDCGYTSSNCADIQYLSTQNTTLITNYVGNATTFGQSNAWATTGGTPNHLTITGLATSCTNGPVRGSAMQGGGVMGLNSFVGCTGTGPNAIAEWVAGCYAVSGTTCPAIQRTLAPGVGIISGSSTFNNQTNSVAATESSHIAVLGVTKLSNNFIDATGGGVGTSANPSVWDFGTGTPQRLMCGDGSSTAGHGPITIGGNVNLVTNGTFNGADVGTSITGKGC